MSDASASTVVVERDIPFAPEKIWRALTQSHLIAEWLMKNDFRPELDHRFTFREDWGSIESRITTIEPNKALSYTWSAMGVETVVTWTLTPTGTGTHLRMEQTGFGPDQRQAFHGARTGWARFFTRLEQVLARTD